MADPMLRDMTEPELSATMRDAADRVTGRLPDGTLFVLIAFDPPDAGHAHGEGQYISNCERASVVEALREVADRLERRETTGRVPFSPTYTCPRCGSVSHSRDDVRLGYCGRCHRFHGTDEV